MFAINHAATALVLKKRYPEVPLPWLLLSVQFVEMMWVIFHFLGVEHTVIDATVHSVRDIHLVHMPWSHSLASSLVLALVVWLLVRRLSGLRVAGVAVAAGVLSHIGLDLITHIPDIAIVPLMEAPKFGLGLYAVPMAAFALETTYGVFCWWIYQGNRKLLLAILLFNLANISFFSVTITGPEIYLANHPLWLAGAVAVQIVVTLLLVGLLAERRYFSREYKARSDLTKGTGSSSFGT